jgi:hypothetical protein
MVQRLAFERDFSADSDLVPGRLAAATHENYRQSKSAKSKS